MGNIPRDRLLVILLALVATVYFTQDAVTGLLTSPFAARQRTRDALARQVAEADRELTRIDHAQKGLQEANHQSLPSDPSVAVALYQEWLIQLAQRTGLTATVVSPGSAIPEGELGYRIPMTLQATARQPQIGQFLDQFQQTPLMHRILHLSLVDADAKSSSGDLRATIQIEAISLTGSEPRQVLFPSGEPSDLATTETSKLARLLSQTPLFDREEPAPTQPVESVTQMPAPPVEIDPLTKIRFIGTWKTSTRQEAWFHDELAQSEFVVTDQIPLKVTTLTGTLLALTNDSVTLDVAGQRHELTLGETLDKLQSKANGPPPPLAATRNPKSPGDSQGEAVFNRQSPSSVLRSTTGDGL